MEKQINQKKELRKQIFITLNGQIRNIYDKIKYSLSIIGKKIGNEIELTPELDLFIRQLNNFAESQPDRQNIHIALSGYRKDINSTFVKYQFMENIEALSEIAQMLIDKKNGQIFKDVKTNVDNLIHLVDEFNKVFTDTLSGISIKTLGKQLVEGGDCGCSGGDDVDDVDVDILNEDSLYEDQDQTTKTTGGNSEYDNMVFNVLGGVTIILSESEFNHYKTMKKSIREIDYYYRIAGVKKNMQLTSLEYENNTENYENILGEEAGFLIDQIQLKYNSLISAIEDENTPANSGFINNDKLYTHGYGIVTGTSAGIKTRLYDDIKDSEATTTEIETFKNGYKFLLEYIRSSKIEMLEAAQALDLYLSKFTQSMQFKPDQIKEFVQILEQIEVVAKWFTDKSGDNLAGVFESFSSVATATAAFTDFNSVKDRHNTSTDIANKLDGVAYEIKGEHYYKDIETASGKVGKFYNARMMTRDQAVNFVKQIEKSIKSVRALENIINTFSRINSNVSSEIKTFMSSGLMFKAFMKYCVASVISIGYLKVQDDKCKATFLASTNAKVLGCSAVHAKMAIGLRFNKDHIQYDTNDQYVSCDPLSITTSKDVETLNFNKNNDICDKIFEMSIKSIITKLKSKYYKNLNK